MIVKAVQENSPELLEAIKPLSIIRIEKDIGQKFENLVEEEKPLIESPVKVDVKKLWGIGGFLLIAFVIAIGAITFASRFGGGFWNFIAAIVASFVVLVILAIVGSFLGIFGEGIVAHFLDKALKALSLLISTGKKAAEVKGVDFKTNVFSEELKILVETSTKLGRSEKENEQLRDEMKRLKEIKKTELRDVIKDVLKEVIIEIRSEKDTA